MKYGSIGSSNWLAGLRSDRPISVPSFTTLQDYTPVTQGLGIITEPSFKYRENAGLIDLIIKFTCGTPTAETIQIGLPLNMVIDPANVPNIKVLGVIGQSANGTEQFNVLGLGGDSYLGVGITNSTLAEGLVPKIGSDLFSSGRVISFMVTVPIQNLAINKEV